MTRTKMTPSSRTVAMNSRRVGRVATVVVGAVLALGACSDSPAGADAPADADVKTFCKAIGGLQSGDLEQVVDDMSEAGTPEGIPDDAREGFEVMIDQADADEISDSDQEKVNAFVAYVATTCGLGE